jgi:site-specific DNA-methyltransferase (cytosine-N4-specific)
MPPIRLNCYWKNDLTTLYHGDSRKILRRLKSQSVHMALTSPPYWNMRVYGGSDEEMGTEETLSDYLQGMVSLFKELHRVLRNDGTFWLNIGDSFLGGNKCGTAGIPWRLAFALEESGWIIRQDVIWRKPNAMPDGSATSRLVKAHEYLFLMVKQPKYYFDSEAIKNATGSLRRSVWDIAAKNYPGHKCAFPEELARLCVLAGTSAKGCCKECGTHYKRLVEKFGGERGEKAIERDRSFEWSRNGKSGSLDGKPKETRTVGWSKECQCKTKEIIPCTVLDPFAGSATLMKVAQDEQRMSIGIELDKPYLDGICIPRLSS